MNRVRLLLVSFVVALLASFAQAQDRRENQIAAGHDPVRNRYLVARQQETGSLEYFLVDASGQVIGDPRALTDKLAYGPSVTWDADAGRFFVVWAQRDADGNPFTVKARFFSPEGDADGDGLDIASATYWRPDARVAYSPQTHRFLVVFCNATAIQGRFVNGDGSFHGDPFDVIPGGSRPGFVYATTPAIAFDPGNGRFLVVAQTFGSGYPPMAIYGAIVNDSDTVSMDRSPFPVLESTTYLYPPSLAFDPVHERYLVVFEVYMGGGHDLAARLLDASGDPVGDEPLLVSDQSVSYGNDVCFKASDGRFLVAWYGADDVQAQEVDADTGAYGARFHLAGPLCQYDLALTHNPVSNDTLLAYGNYQTARFVVTPPPPTTDLAVTIGAGDGVLAGHELTLAVTVANEGAEAAPGVIVTTPLPGGVAFVSAAVAQGTFTHDASSVEWQVGALASGSNATLTLVVTPQSPGRLTFHSTTKSAAVDTNPSNDTGAAGVRAFENLVVSPLRGTTGSVIEIRGENLGAAKGRVALAGGGRPVALEILSWNKDGSGVVRALVAKAPPAGTYDVVVTPRRAAPVTEAGACEIAVAEVVSSPWSCAPGERMSITATFLGTAKGRIYLEYNPGTGVAKRKKARVLAWPRDSATAPGDVEILMPKKSPLGPGTLVVKNAAGEARVAIQISE